MDKPELKPSPLAGEPAVFDSRLLQEIVHYRVRSRSLKTSWHTSKKLAARAWNQRPIEDALKDENERLRDCLRATTEYIGLLHQGFHGEEFSPRQLEICKQALKEQP